LAMPPSAWWISRSGLWQCVFNFVTLFTESNDFGCSRQVNTDTMLLIPRVYYGRYAFL
jgi:hypothetical protein